MNLTLDKDAARKADRISTAINNAGKFVGVITRAEKLLSEKGTEGLGISFRTADGMTANYLDLYTHNKHGETLPSYSIAQAILACTSTREATEGQIEVEKWDKDAKTTYKALVPGYPSLMGKKIGLLLQKELATNDQNGKDTERMIIYGVFNPDNELTASEIMDKKTQPEKLAKMVEALAVRPINDRRKNGQVQQSSRPAAAGSGFEDFDDDIPF